MSADDALAAVARGWSVIPVRPGDKKAKAAWKHAQRSRATSADVASWFDETPTINHAVVTGQLSGLVVLDIDPAHGGMEAARELFAAHGNPQTLMVRTWSDGLHVYFSFPKEGLRNSAGTLGPGLDIRGEGGYVVGVGSHIDGKPYRWEPGYGPEDREVAPMPSWLLALANQPEPAPNPKGANGLAGDLIKAGTRNSTLLKQAGKLRRAGLEPDEIEVALQSLNERLCDPPLPKGEVAQLAHGSPAQWAPGPVGSTTRARPAAQTAALSEYPEEDVAFLQYPRVPLGKFVVVDGEPDAGKSYIACNMLAAETTGGLVRECMPGWNATEPRNTLYIAGEDGYGDTLHARVKRMGGNPALVRVLTLPTIVDGFSFDEQGLQELRAVITEFGIRLVVIDPFWAFVDQDMYRPNEIRKLTTQLSVLAAECNVTIIAIRHLVKGAVSKAIHKGQGTIDITAAARSVLMAGVAPESGQRALVHIKSNLATKARALNYQIDRDGEFSWRGESDLSAADLTASDMVKESKEDSCAKWLVMKLQAPGGPKLMKVIESEAMIAGHSTATLRRAKKTLGVLSYQRHAPGVAGGQEWCWRLDDQTEPDAAAPHGYEGLDAQDSGPREIEHLALQGAFRVEVGDE